MTSVKKAVVLAAGLGTRLRPFTCATPKPLMPVWGETMLDRVVALLRERGVDDLVVNAHHLHEQIEAWAVEYRRRAEASGDKVSLRVSYEPVILGNGGVLNPIRDWIGDESFYLVNSDIVMENVPELPEPKGDEIGTCLVAEAGPRTIEVEPESRFVTNWHSDDAGLDGTWTYCGLAILRPDILDYVPPEGFSSIVSAFEKAMMEGRFMRAVSSDDLLWEDAGTILSYVDLNRDGDENAFAFIPQLAATGAKDFRFLSERGSERIFFGCDRGVAILYDDATRKENGLYAAQARFLKARGVPVPDVVVDLPDLKTLVLSDAGVERKMSFEDYTKVIDALVRFNAVDVSGIETMPAFDAASWEWERNLFREHCLEGHFGLKLEAAVEAELVRVAERLEREPKGLVHRDFQSTNVLWKGGELRFIDFQGMRPGPAVYDLASLLYDPYVTFTDRERRALAALYGQKAGRADITDVLPIAAVERLVQCLGAYGRLVSVGQPQFAKFVLPALENLLAAADEAGLEAVGALAEDLIAREQRAKEPAHPHDCTCGCHCHESR